MSMPLLNRHSGSRERDEAAENLSDIERIRAEARELVTRLRRNAHHQDAEVADQLRAAASALDDWCNDDIYAAADRASAILRRWEARLAA